MVADNCMRRARPYEAVRRETSLPGASEVTPGPWAASLGRMAIDAQAYIPPPPTEEESRSLLEEILNETKIQQADDRYRTIEKALRIVLDFGVLSRPEAVQIDRA